MHPGPLRTANLFGLGRDHFALGIPPSPIRLLQFGALAANGLLAGRLGGMGPLKIGLGLGLKTGELVNFEEQSIPLSGGESQIHSLELVENLAVTTGLARLPLEGSHLAAHFPQDIREAEQVGLGSL